MAYHPPTYQYRYKYKYNYPPIDAPSPSPSCIPSHTSLPQSPPASVINHFNTMTFDYFVNALYHWTVTHPKGNVCGHDLHGYPLARFQKNQLLEIQVNRVWAGLPDDPYHFTVNRQMGNDHTTVDLFLHGNYYYRVPSRKFPTIRDYYKPIDFFRSLCTVPPPKEKPDFSDLLDAVIAAVIRLWTQEPIK
jgi:hypothetical protein